MKKKRLSLKFIEEHTIAWALDRLDEIRDEIEGFMASKDTKKYPEQLRMDILSLYVKGMEDVLELLFPFEHNEQQLTAWAINFIEEFDCPTEDELSA